MDTTDDPFDPQLELKLLRQELAKWCIRILKLEVKLEELERLLEDDHK